MKESENRIQSKSFQYHWNKYPNERGLLCYNLNNSRNEIDGNQNKGLGLIKGRADMTYYHPSETVFLEFKTEDGKQSPMQKDWQSLVERNGFKYIVVRSFEQFKKLIDEKFDHKD